MGNSCCRAESPCGSAEERSGLLKDDSKVTVPTGETVVVGTCGPEGDDDIRKMPDEATIKLEEAVQVKQNPEVAEPKNTQENGPLQKEVIQTATPSPRKGSELKENSTRVQDEAMKDRPADSGQAELLQCTLNSLQNQHATADWEVFTATNAAPEEENPASAQDKIPVSSSLTAEAVCPENHSEANTTREHITLDNTHDNEEEAGSIISIEKAVTEPPVEFAQNNEVLSVPNPQLSAAACQMSSISAVGQENDKESASCSDSSGASSSDQLTKKGPRSGFAAASLRLQLRLEVESSAPGSSCSSSGQEQSIVLTSTDTTLLEAQAVLLGPLEGREAQENQDCAVTEDSGSSSVCTEGCGPEVIRSHDVCESSPGSEPTGLNHSGEERDGANCVREPEATAPADASDSSKSDQGAPPHVECTTSSSKEVASSEDIKQDIAEEIILKGKDKDEDVPKGKEDNEMKEEVEKAPSEVETGKDTEIQEVTWKEEDDVKADEIPVTEREDAAEDGLDNSEEDLYRGAEELSASQKHKPETTFLKVEDRCSLAPAVDILSYSEREWKGNTAKSALIRKGYKEMSQRFGSVRRVRGDNYCALRATLFQVLSHSSQLPTWLQGDDINMLLKQLEAQEGLISQWTFPGECLQADGTGDATLQLKGYMELLLNKWQAAVDCSSAAERQQLCERVFQGGKEELGLMEALKLLMLGRAVELHGCMQAGGDVPLFCWLLFARDSSDCPRSFLSNHLSHVGLSAGLEQVEMFLLGYALQCTIQVYRLYKADTEEFVTYYPDDHKDDWPSVCLVTEDDRHYNVPVVEAAEELHEQLNSS